MWIYKGKSLRHRLKLNPALGFWLDYWLFLHSIETHPIWCARPFGLRSIASATLKSNTPYDVKLRKQLKREIASAIHLSAQVEEINDPPANRIISDGKKWESRWLHWFEDVLYELDPKVLQIKLIQNLSNDLSGQNLWSAAYWTRRLAAELGEDEWSPGQLFKIAKHTICDSGSYDELELNTDKLSMALIDLFVTGSKASYSVCISAASVPISKSVIKNTPKGLELIVESDAQRGCLLTGISTVVEALHSEQAAAIGVEVARKMLQSLRLRFNIRTHMYGGVKVVDESGDERWFSLPQPFWPKISGHRKVPRLPKRFDALVTRLSEEDRGRWNAARWHLSRAFSDWAEDVHAAATQVWQALEAFACRYGETGLKCVISLVPEYLSITPIEIREFLASSISMQASELLKIFRPKGVTLDWYYWDSAQVDLIKWLARVLDCRSPWNFRQWATPPAPLIVFDESVGLIQTISRRIRNERKEQWMERRIEGDLILLYGLRNKVVHGGERLFSKRMAGYLGRLGAEIILSIMGKEAQQDPPTASGAP